MHFGFHDDTLFDLRGATSCASDGMRAALSVGAASGDPQAREVLLMRIAFISAGAAIAFIALPAFAEEMVPGSDAEAPLRSQRPIDEERPMQNDEVVRPAPMPAPTLQGPTTYNDRGRRVRDIYAPFGIDTRIIDVQVGVGSGDFIAQKQRDLTAFGGTWDARAVVGADSPIALEAAYTGGAQGLRASGTDRNANSVLLNNGLEGGVKVGLPLEAGNRVHVKPFVDGGLGWKHYTLVGEGASTGGLQNDDSQMVVPVGAGVDIGVGNLKIDTRATYRHALFADMFGNTSGGFGDPNEMHTWNLQASLGFAF